METYDEQLDLVDHNDRKIGVVGRSEIPRLLDGQHGFLRTACALIRNSRGDFWIPCRTDHKEIAPGGLDLAMSEHMGVDEPYLQAAIRGFSEELNMEVWAADLQPIGKLSPLPRVPYFAAIYLHETDTEPPYNPNDYQSAEWCSAEAVIAKVEGGMPAKDLLVPALKMLLAHEDQL